MRLRDAFSIPEPLTAMNFRLTIIPAIITLAVTILRLVGELQHWSARWFSTETGGIRPHDTSWIIGITWLAALFGVYFAWRLIQCGRAPKSLGKAIIFAVLGILIFFAYYPVTEFLATTFHFGFPHYLIVIWFCWILAGAIQYAGWPELFKVLLLYAYAARIPVAIVMFFAMIGHWGTHYDYVGMQIPLSGLPRYLWLAFFPQLVGWVGFTITLGSAAGILLACILRLWRYPTHNRIDRADLNSIS